MLERDQVKRILRALNSLPSDKISEVQDFIQFLNARYAVDDGDVWTDEDVRDFTSTTLRYADESL